MAKSKPLHWQEPVTETCPQCDGSGEWRGMFSSGPCAGCDGTGVVGEDGEPLPPHEILPVIRRQRDRLQQRLDGARQHYQSLLQVPGVREALDAHRRQNDERQRAEDMALRKRLRGG